MEELEAAKKRCRSVIETIQRLPSSTSITASCSRTLLKLASSELSFLSSLSADPSPPPLSVNIGHLEAVVRILQLPSVTGVSRVCKPLPLPTGSTVHVDVVCTLGKTPAWIIVSDRNPRYISWHGERRRSKGLRLRIENFLAVARSTHTLRPSSVILFFANGLPGSVHEKLRDEFGATDFEFGSDFSVFDCDIDFYEELEGEWISVVQNRSFTDAIALEIKLTDSSVSLPTQKPTLEVQRESTELNQKDAFSSLLSTMRLHGNPIEEDYLVNFDTTALVACVSGISNGCGERILATPEIELKQRFKGNAEFVIAQVRSELQNPMLEEMGNVLSGRRGIICESVLSEFKELVSMCGGPNEKHRADQLEKCLLVVPDNPSARMMGLPTTRKLGMKNKVVFGTGDHWHAPTLTANMAFLRAVAQTGMSLSTIEHRPRALTGD